MSLADDIRVVDRVEGILAQHNVTAGFTIISDDMLQLCSTIPTDDFQDCLSISAPRVEERTQSHAIRAEGRVCLLPHLVLFPTEQLTFHRPSRAHSWMTLQ